MCADLNKKPCEEAATALRLTEAGKGLLQIHRYSPGVSRQFMPDPRENLVSPEQMPDPIGDQAHEVLPGLIHRYPNRVLFTLTDRCAAYCRFCFRKNALDGKGVQMDKDKLGKAVDYIASHTEINEVIFSGGDPLILSPRRWRELLSLLEPIEHVRRYRIHTRLPVMDPARINDALLDFFRHCEKEFRVALHINHPDELTQNVRSAILRMGDTFDKLLSQSVLLAGINDNVETLAKLYSEFATLGITAYQLHHLDKAYGTAHFHVPIERGLTLMESLRGRVPQSVPLADYMLDIPGGYGKVNISDPQHVIHLSGSEYKVIDPHGNSHRYYDCPL